MPCLATASIGKGRSLVSMSVDVFTPRRELSSGLSILMHAASARIGDCATRRRERRDPESTTGEAHSLEEPLELIRRVEVDDHLAGAFLAAGLNPHPRAEVLAETAL